MSDEKVCEVQYCQFVVDKTPYCIWDKNLRKLNLDFLDSIDPNYFKYLADVHGNLLDSEERQYAATALRTTYSQALESLFAFLCATVQIPNCPVGWLLKYQNRELFEVIRKIQNGEEVLTKLTIDHVTWETLAKVIYPYSTGNTEDDDFIHSSFACLWRRFAEDFLCEHTAEEYNSIKHGLRLQIGGFNLQSFVEKMHGEPPDLENWPEDMRSLRGSAFGSAFFVSERLDNSFNFRLNHKMVNWNPEKYVVALRLVAMSIGNVVSFLKIVSGRKLSEVQFMLPSDKAIYEEPWTHTVDTLSLTRTQGFKGVTCRTKENILACYKSRDGKDNSDIERPL